MMAAAPPVSANARILSPSSFAISYLQHPLFCPAPHLPSLILGCLSEQPGGQINKSNNNSLNKLSCVVRWRITLCDSGEDSGGIKRTKEKQHHRKMIEV